MAGKQQQDKKINFKTINLFKDQTLGIGSYGAVCKAKCDDLLCAAKIIHPTLFDSTAQHQVASHRKHRLPIRRFQLECEFLSTVRHPNIVQYLGTHQDAETCLPVLLMELMDDSLTHFLESSPQPIPYHIQVNICHDITLALSFLHSNGIVHRDLSSNNVLLIGNVRAKVTDFGMMRLGYQNQRAARLTMCPGTDVYMPPEAVKDKPVYTEKIDCFSFGVVTVQIMTREFPKPGDRRKEIQVKHPGLPPIVEVPVSEIERRQNQIDQINPNHPLKQVALDCLKDRDVERLSAQQLCERVAALKEDPQYGESVRVVEARSSAEQGRSDERDSELRSLRQQYNQQVRDLQQIIQLQMYGLAEKDQTIARKEETITQNDQILREKDETITELRQQIIETEKEKGIVIEEKERELRHKMHVIDSLERQLECIKQQLEESERAITQFKVQQIHSYTDTSSSSKEQRANIKLTWREGGNTPCKMSTTYYTAIGGSTTIYVRQPSSYELFHYIIGTSSWFRLPNCPVHSCPSVITNNHLTLVGGFTYGGILTNQLFSLTGEGSRRRWTKEFPSMPTKRWGSSAMCTGTALIIAGGARDRSTLHAVEILNTETLQWSTAADLPKPLSYAPSAVSGDDVYILGMSNMYASSVSALIQSCERRLVSTDSGVWKEVAAPPVIWITGVSIRGRLLAIGGKDSDRKVTAAVHMYDPTTDSWEVISHMGTPRYHCTAAVLPNNQLMVVGGRTSRHVSVDSVEFATIE